MRPKFQKQSELKLAGRIIPRSGGFNTPQLAAESFSKACFGVHTRRISNLMADDARRISPEEGIDLILAECDTIGGALS